MEKKSLKIAILDLYEGVANQGMRGLRDIVHLYGKENNLDIQLDEFEVRLQNEVPDLSYDIYISSGGPGSPLDSEGSEWERLYFNWLRKVENWNNDNSNFQKKFVFFICHSYQLACRHFRVGTVCKRKSTAFGVFPIHMLPDGVNEQVFDGLRDPFYSVDSRDYQVISPDYTEMEQTGVTVLALEKERPHVPFERALMAIRFNEYMIGTQFHPEADAVGMSMYLQREDKKTTVIAEHGEIKWRSMIEHLNDPDKILWTYSHILPNFFNMAVGELIAA
ncbi:MAG TPA: GMP synthase [Chitinophagaceae bacterium]|jgi:GMP synthase-like glutamine amidotransferase|nr:GMP synthase [Chitinophagaceae bacterium]